MNYPKFKVCVRSFTYNQSAYITDTMNGFVMQQTTYPFVCCIVDDASTDGEQKVIRKYFNENFNLEDKDTYYEQQTDYATIIYAQHRTNLNCYFAIFFLKENLYSKGQSAKKFEYLAPFRQGCTYEALCEGDDYWIHPQKLQMQTDFLDEHTDYVLCHTDFKLLNGKYKSKWHDEVPNDNYFPRSITYGVRIGTLTSMFRHDIYEKLPKLWKGKGWPMGDLPLWIELSKEGKIKYIPVVTSTYRILPQSASHGSIEFELRMMKACLEVAQCYAKYYGRELKNDGYTKAYFLGCMKSCFKHRRKDFAKEYKNMAKEKSMTSVKMYFFYYATFIKPLSFIISKILPY